jgi:hypothetical protein
MRIMRQQSFEETPYLRQVLYYHSERKVKQLVYAERHNACVHKVSSLKQRIMSPGLAPGMFIYFGHTAKACNAEDIYNRHPLTAWVLVLNLLVKQTNKTNRLVPQLILRIVWMQTISTVLTVGYTALLA